MGKEPEPSYQSQQERPELNQQITGSEGSSAVSSGGHSGGRKPDKVPPPRVTGLDPGQAARALATHGGPGCCAP